MCIGVATAVSCVNELKPTTSPDKKPAALVELPALADKKPAPTVKKPKKNLILAQKQLAFGKENIVAAAARSVSDKSKLPHKLLPHTGKPLDSCNAHATSASSKQKRGEVTMERGSVGSQLPAPAPVYYWKYSTEVVFL